MKKHLLLLFFLLPALASAQTLTDGLMMPKGDLCTGFLFSHDQWNNYWEGGLKRDNLNIGTLTTRSLMWVGNYGVTRKLNVIAMLPYVKTKADRGTLASMDGIQDLTIGAKYNFFKQDYAKSTFKTFGVVGFSTPLSDYTPDFFPLSLGTGTTNLFYRLTANYKFLTHFYVNGSAGYTWRSNAKLDRATYFTNDQLYYTNEVKMPNVFDYTVSVGFIKQNFQLDLAYLQQNTLGGSDIRRQDMPFVSNRMNFAKTGVTLMYYVPKVKNLAVRGATTFTVAGRNVGQSTTITGGVLYTLHFAKTTTSENQ